MPHDLVRIRQGDGDRKEHQLDSLAPYPLAEGGQHATVLLVAAQDLIAALQGQPKLADLKTLRGVARDGHLLGVGAQHLGQGGAYLLTPLVLEPPHDVGRCAVGLGGEPLEGFLDGLGRRADPAVVEVHHAAVHGEGLLHGAPLGLLPCELGSRAVVGSQVGEARQARGILSGAAGG